MGEMLRELWTPACRTEALEVDGAPARVLIPGSALVYRPSASAIDETAPLGPVSPYGLSKLAQEMLGLAAARQDGMTVLISRSFTHVGPGQALSYAASSFAEQIARIESGRAEPVLSVGNLEARRDLTDVRDTVRAYQLLMTRGTPATPYNVCSGRPVSILDVASALCDARGGISPAVTGQYRSGDVRHIVADPAKAAQRLGFRAAVDPGTGLREFADAPLRG